MTEAEMTDEDWIEALIVQMEGRALGVQFMLRCADPGDIRTPPSLMFDHAPVQGWSDMAYTAHNMLRVNAAEPWAAAKFERVKVVVAEMNRRPDPFTYELPDALIALED